MLVAWHLSFSGIQTHCKINKHSPCGRQGNWAWAAEWPVVTLFEGWNHLQVHKLSEYLKLSKLWSLGVESSPCLLAWGLIVKHSPLLQKSEIDWKGPQIWYSEAWNIQRKWHRSLKTGLSSSLHVTWEPSDQRELNTSGSSLSCTHLLQLLIVKQQLSYPVLL